MWFEKMLSFTSLLREILFLDHLKNIASKNSHIIILQMQLYQHVDAYKTKVKNMETKCQKVVHYQTKLWFPFKKIAYYAANSVIFLKYPGTEATNSSCRALMLSRSQKKWLQVVCTHRLDTIFQVNAKEHTFQCKEIKEGSQMRQLCKVLLYAVSESMLLVPLTSEENGKEHHLTTSIIRHIFYWGQKNTETKQYLFRITPPAEGRERLQTSPDILTTNSGNTIPKLLCNCKSRSFQTRSDWK